MEPTVIALVVLAVALGAALITVRRLATQYFIATLTIGSLQRAAKDTLNQLNMLDNRLENLANTSFDALLIVDAQRHVMLINEAGRALFSSGQPGQTLMTATRHHQLDNLAVRCAQLNDALEDQIELNGRSFKVRASRIANGSVALALQDVTELLRLTRARRDMVANISHELRTPISTIRLLVDTLSQSLGRNPERDLRQLGKIASQTDSLQFLTEELHELSMIESGKAIMRMIETPLNTIAHDAIDRMITQVEKKKLELLNTITDDVCVLADPDQTRRVLTNLISNAVKFTPSGGKITLSARTAADMVTVRVADSGPGIPPNERVRIFERFYQIDSARSGGPHNGSGLGLSIAKHIIEAQGGEIWAEGAEPHGACICFTLPQT